MKTVQCKSGLRGWQAPLHEVFASLAEFRACASVYSLHKRLGYRSMIAAWRDNPVVQGSVEPSDYCKV